MKAVDPFWKGRRVLVTGHTGFKGAWLSLWLRRLEADVTGFALAPSSTPSLFELAGLADDIRSIEGDIRDATRLRDVLVGTSPEVVFHLAAQSLVRPSYEEPIGTFATNVMGTVHVLDAVRHAPSVRAVVIVTSDKSYENREWEWGYRETDPMGGHDPYSASKGCAEIVTASFRRSYFSVPGAPAVASARAGNVIGGGDWAADRLVPDAMRAFARAETLRVRNPGATRPWQHVLEPLEGYLRLAQRLVEAPAQHADGWNFGPGDAGTETVAAVVGRLAQLWGDGARWAAHGEPQLHEAQALKLDSSKARARLGWRPRLSLDVALEWTTEWYRAVAHGASARELTLGQIEKFEGRR